LHGRERRHPGLIACPGAIILQGRAPLAGICLNLLSLRPKQAPPDRAMAKVTFRLCNTVWSPLRQSHTTAWSDLARSKAETMSPDVLVVEDDEAIRHTIEVILEDEGYDVALATNGREALDRITADPPKMVLLDLQMPVMTGWEVTERVQQQGLDVPLVFMTAGHRAQTEAERYHVAGFLGKPFELDDLLDTVARFVQTRQ
jgi:CheY-like chemotaxis protein